MACVAAIPNFDDNGWHDTGPSKCWPSSNYQQFASGDLYEPDGIFLLQTNFVFTTMVNSATCVITQQFDAILGPDVFPSLSGEAYAWEEVDDQFRMYADDIGWRWPDVRGFSFMVYTNYTTRYHGMSERRDVYLAGTLPFTYEKAAALQGELVPAKFDARQVRMWDCYNAIRERAYALEGGTHVGWATFIPYNLPAVTFYRHANDAIYNMQSFVFQANLVYYNRYDYEDAKYYVRDVVTQSVMFDSFNYYNSFGWVAKAQVGDVANMLNDWEAEERVAYTDRISDGLRVDGSGSDPSRRFSIFALLDIPTNFGYWVPANLSWIENVPHAQIESAQFLRVTNATSILEYQWVTNVLAPCPSYPIYAIDDEYTNDNAESLVAWPLALQGVEAGRVSTDYGLDQLRRILSEMRYLACPARFRVTSRGGGGQRWVWVSDPAPGHSEFVTTVNPTVYPVGEYAQSVGWTASSFNRGGDDLNTSWAWSKGVLEFGPEQCAAELLKNATGYGRTGERYIDGSGYDVGDWSAIETTEDTYASPIVASEYGREAGVGDIPGGGAVGSFHAGEYIEVAGAGVLDYDAGFKYK